MHLNCYCPGCGGGDGNQPCAIAKCSLEHEGIEYCFECSNFPCEKYNKADGFDSFITHKNQLKDIEKAKEIGISEYNKEQSEKVCILKYLLDNYNNGRRKTFFCVAVNLLDLRDLRNLARKLEENSQMDNLSLKEKALYAVGLFNGLAEERKIKIALHRKPKKG